MTYYQNDIKNFEKFEVKSYTVSIIDYLKDLSANIVKKVSKKSAKERAIRLMDEVGIPDPQKRCKQDPFQFSGGMRQRIVIAIYSEIASHDTQLLNIGITSS